MGRMDEGFEDNQLENYVRCDGYLDRYLIKDVTCRG